MTLLDDRAVAGLRALVGDAAGPGDVLDARFELRERIGEGGMGVVWSAWDRTGEREVAVKIASPGAEARFALEIDVLAKVSHPAIVRAIAEGTHEGARFFAMDRLHGVTLAEKLARGRLDVAQAVALGRRIAEGLAAVHDAGIAHRDVKPSNVFLEDGDPARPRLLDFGVARARTRTPANGAITKTGALVGTPGYMAPEQARGERGVGPPADVFALGCVLFECLTSRPAFAADDTEALLTKIMLEAVPSPRAFTESVPAQLDALVVAMLDKDPAKRPGALDVARTLEAVESSRALSGERESPSERPSSSLVPGAIIAGKYRLEERLGEGGMGIVVAARHLELGKRVALKILRGGPSADDARFLREARAASRLESEHVSRVLDVGRTDDGTPFIVMEHLSGTDLARLLRERGPLDVKTAARYVLDACAAIGEAHALGIVHRDLKPSNLFLVERRDGEALVKVLDFGISKVTRALDDSLDDVSVTGAAGVVGSVSYMSPEQIQSAKDVDARSDVWSLGVVLFELVTAHRPFEGDSAAAVGARIAAAEPKRIRDFVDDAPAGMESVIARCLEKDPARRFPDVHALIRALAPFAGDARTAPLHAAARRRAIAVASAIAGAAVLAIALFVVSGRESADDPTLRVSPSAESSASPPASAPERSAASALPSTFLNGSEAPAPAATNASTTPSAQPHAPRVVAAPPRARASASPATSISASVSPSASVAPATSRASGLDLRDPALETR